MRVRVGIGRRALQLDHLDDVTVTAVQVERVEQQRQLLPVGRREHPLAQQVRAVAGVGVVDPHRLRSLRGGQCRLPELRVGEAAVLRTLLHRR